MSTIVLAAASIGHFGWASHEFLTPLPLIIPFLWARSGSRKSAFAVMFSYYLGASWGILGGAYTFFQDGSVIRAFLLWTGSAATLASVWALFYIKKNDRWIIPIKLIAVTILLTAPPIGLIGWTNPLLSLGYFFPEVPNNSRFVGINTSFGQLASGSGDPSAGYERLKAVFEKLNEGNGENEKNLHDFVVLPETVAGRMSGIGEMLWEDETKRLFGKQFSKKTLFVGAELPSQNEKYENVLISFGGNNRLIYRQRIPVPFSMYRPWDSTSGANAHLFEPEILTLNDGTKAGVIICYEQFVSWSWLLMFAANNFNYAPLDIIICTANNWWSKDTPLPRIQERSRSLWSRILGVPVVSAENR